tara:strand:+ start:142 stop:495 length:354 start_codon:yes stop_codon:yes gene_type:complete
MKLTKSHLKKLIQEAASEYVWGVKGPQRVANQYVRRFGMKLKESQLKELVKEELEQFFEGDVMGSIEATKEAETSLGQTQQIIPLKKKLIKIITGLPNSEDQAELLQTILNAIQQTN